MRPWRATMPPREKFIGKFQKSSHLRKSDFPTGENVSLPHAWPRRKPSCYLVRGPHLDRGILLGTEVWFRNPHDYVRELVEVGECNVAWDRGLLVKRRINPIEHAELYFGKAFQWRVLAVGSQGSAEYRPGDKLEKPTAVYPTWEYGEDSTILEEMIEYPMGEDMEACLDMSVRPDERPVPGQEHRVIITNMPNTRTGPGKSFLRYLKSLQEDYPNCIIHVHGLYGYKAAFGFGFGAADVEPRSAASKGRVHLMSGSEEKWERLIQKPQWATALGFKPNDLEIPRNRCMYNIKAAVWAGKNYIELYKFKAKGQGSGDYTSPDKDHKPATTLSPFSTAVKAKEGDKMLCDTCSLQNQCKYFRDGAVCTLPGAEPVRLAAMFKTRDADSIIDGLGTLLAANTNRLERGLHYEEVDGELDPEVSKMMGQVFDQGVKLAKLLEPGRFSGGAKVQVNVGGGATASVSAANPRQFAAAAIQALVNQGIPRDKITPDMVAGMLEGMANPDSAQKAIAGTVVSSSDE